MIGVKRKPAKYEEHKLQIQLVAFVRMYYGNQVRIWGSDGTSKSAREGDKKKKLGYETGQPDVTIYSRKRAMLPLLMELKRPANKLLNQRGGKESNAQKTTRKEFIELGHKWIVIDNLEKGINEIKQYFNL